VKRIGTWGPLLSEYRAFKHDLLDSAQSAVFTNALVRSSGPFSLAELRQAGHPYSARFPNPAYDPATINVQSGDFRENWKKPRPVVGDDNSQAQVTNDDKKADWLINGTKTKSGKKIMIPRPIDDAVERDSKDSVRRVERQAVLRMERSWRKRILP